MKKKKMVNEKREEHFNILYRINGDSFIIW